MFLTMDQIFNLAAKWKYMYGAEKGVPVVFRGIVGRGWGQGATHSQSLQATFAHFPGLHVAAPASPADAKGLLISALQGSTPVVLLENRALYELEGDVPEEPTPIPFGRGRIVREGRDITVVGASLMAYEATRAADMLAEQGISAEQAGKHPRVPRMTFVTRVSVAWPKGLYAALTPSVTSRMAETSAPRPSVNAVRVISPVAPWAPYPGSRKIECGSRFRSDCIVCGWVAPTTAPREL